MTTSRTVLRTVSIALLCIINAAVAFADTTYTGPGAAYTVTIPDGWMRSAATIEGEDVVYTRNETSPIPLFSMTSNTISESAFGLPSSAIDFFLSDDGTEILLSTTNDYMTSALGLPSTETVVESVDPQDHSFNSANTMHTMTFDASLGEDFGDVRFTVISVRESTTSSRAVEMTFVVPVSTRREYTQDMDAIVGSVHIQQTLTASTPSVYRDPENHYMLRLPAGWRVAVGATSDTATFNQPNGPTTLSIDLEEVLPADSLFSEPLTQSILNGDITFNDETVVEYLQTLFQETDAIDLGAGLTIDNIKLLKYEMNEDATVITMDVEFTTSVFGVVKARIIEIPGNYEALRFQLTTLKDDFDTEVQTLAAIVDSVEFYEIPNFTDVPASNPHAKAIHELRVAGVIDGYDGSNFGPTLQLRRAELLKMALEGIDVDVSAYATMGNPFSDLPSDHTLLPYVLYAYHNGIATGYGNGTFGPDNTTTNAEAVKMILNITQFSTAAAPEGVTYDLPAGSDLIGYVHNAVKLNALYDEPNFDTHREIQRDYTAEIIYRLLWIRGTGATQYTE